jgi:glycosyltransferase involved in cell wall biosynthesis
VRYLGRISRDRVPYQLIEALSEAVRTGSVSADRIRFEFYGEAGQLSAYLSERHPALLKLFEFHDAVPYREAVRLMLTADWLLFAETSDQSSLSAKGVLTTKLFEYLACERPIIAEIREDTEAGRLIRGGGPGHIVAHTAEAFVGVLPALMSPAAAVSSDREFTRALSRESQAADYLSFLDTEICGATS